MTIRDRLRHAMICCALTVAVVFSGGARVSLAESPSWLKTGQFQWKCSPPLIDIDHQAAEPEVALKDPTFVQFDGRWHLFATHRLASGMVNMQYLSFTGWAETGKATRHTLELHDQYHCAPQVFWFTPQKKWYLVYQLADKNRALKFAPYFSTTSDISDPKSWTKPQPMIERLPEGGDKTKWIDFWVICDADKAHLFYTSDDGHFWRRETAKTSFPLGWSKPELLLQDSKDELFEASCTYKLRGRDQYLTIIEAIGSGCRYYKAWLADKLEGPWKPLAATKDKPFAAVGANVDQAERWTSSISHGELIRSGTDELMEIDPADLRFVFQGVDDAGYKGNRYGSIPWRIGVLELTTKQGAGGQSLFRDRTGFPRTIIHPLTPALSPWERETMALPRQDENVLSKIERQLVQLPLPLGTERSEIAGEESSKKNPAKGWGEGEDTIRSSISGSSLANALQLPIARKP